LPDCSWQAVSCLVLSGKKNIAPLLVSSRILLKKSSWLAFIRTFLPHNRPLNHKPSQTPTKYSFSRPPSKPPSQSISTTPHWNL
jgi:hypothetical protein